MKQNFIENNIIILSKQTLDVMLKKEHPSDLIGLYCFYYYTAKWQETNIIKCATGYVMKGLNWSKEKVIENKKALKGIGLIEDSVSKNKKGQIVGWYIKLNYIWKRDTIKNQKVAQPEGGLNQPVANPDTNALSANNINALNANSVATTSVAGLNDIIELFKNVNPSYEKLFANKTQRQALEGLVKQHGREKIEWAVNVLPKTNRIKYAPTITTPLALENKLGDLIAFLQKEKTKVEENKITKI